MDLAIFPELSRKHSGSYFTPQDVAASLVTWACKRPTDQLLDPSCGDGQFLRIHSNSVGVEQNPLSARQASARAPHAKVHKAEFFAWAKTTAERFECAAGNPPFIRYQTFKGEVRQRALEHCLQLGARFSGLTSSWAPFLVATAGLLKPGGRMAFVVPAEIGHAPYSAPMLEYLVASFSKVQIIAIRAKLFPALSEDCWLLYADNFGGRADAIDLSIVDEFRPSKAPPDTNVLVNLEEWRNLWNRRLRSYLLPSGIRRQYAKALANPKTRRLSEFASVGIGYVSGDNSFFHLRPSEAKRWGIPSGFLHPTVRNGRAMPVGHITAQTIEDWNRNDDPHLLLRLSQDQDLPASVHRYLASTAGREARLGYKCRNRTPWYAVPDVQIPDYVMSYMSGRRINLALNVAGVTCANSVHSVRVKNKKLAAKLFSSWSTPFVRLSCEIEGHALGGGMLKLEPREAARIVFPCSTTIADMDQEALNDAITTLQRWRHYAN